jgi:hypothetical protein
MNKHLYLVALLGSLTIPLLLILPNVMPSMVSLSMPLLQGTLTPTAFVYLPYVVRQYPLLTTTPTPTTPAPFAPNDGLWRFTSTGVIPIRTNQSGFSVSSGSIPSLGFSIWVNDYPCNDFFWNTQPITIADNSFSFSYYSGMWVVSGSFTSPTTATGHMHVAYIPLPDCRYSYLSYDDFWQATWNGP